MKKFKNKKLASALLAATALLGDSSAPKTLANDKNNMATQNLKVENTKSKYTTAQWAICGTLGAFITAGGIGYFIYDNNKKEKLKQDEDEDRLKRHYPYAEKAVKLGYFKNLKEFKEYIDREGNYHRDVEYAVNHGVTPEEAKKIRKQQEQERFNIFADKFAHDLDKKITCKSLAQKFGMEYEEFTNKYREIIEKSENSAKMEMAIKFTHNMEIKKKKFQQTVEQFRDPDLIKIVNSLNKELESKKESELKDDTQNDKEISVPKQIFNTLERRYESNKNAVLLGFKALMTYDEFQIEKQGNKFIINANNVKGMHSTCSVELQNNQILLSIDNFRTIELPLS